MVSMNDAITKLAFVDPQCIYIEHICIAFDISRKHARKVCREAVARGLLFRQIQVLCPDGSVAAFAASHKNLPAAIECVSDRHTNCKLQVLKTKKLRKREVFALLNSNALFEFNSFPEPKVL